MRVMRSGGAGSSFEFVDLADREAGQLGDEVIGEIFTKHILCYPNLGALFAALLTDSDAALFADSKAFLEPPQYGILQIELINHMCVPPIRHSFWPSNETALWSVGRGSGFEFVDLTGRKTGNA